MAIDSRALLSATLALAVGGPLAPAPAVAQSGLVEAGGQRCISATFVRQVAGVYDSSYVQYANRCGEPVGFFWCQASVYQPGYAACDAKLGTFNTTNAGVGWSTRMSASASARSTVIVIRECPSRTQPYLKTDGKFYCRP
ncbi:MAG: hypothetical protein PGN08_13980 [Sphingomonas taxi]